jgi:uncharacterized protein YjiS (DUF1127 family)
MSTQTALMRSRAGAMTQFAENLTLGVSAIGGFIAARAERARVYHELSNLSDRDLADIGIARHEVPRIADLAQFPELQRR